MCTSSNCAGACPYPTGAWVVCNGCGPGSGSYKVCTDCKLSSCSPHCTCLSGCLCTGCGSFSEMLDDMRERGIAVS
jgi:hypothetical protein